MRELTDKAVILLLTLSIYIPNTDTGYRVAPILAVIILSALLSYFEKERLITIGTFITYLVLSLFIPPLLFFIPLICYDAILADNRWIWLLGPIPLAAAPTGVIVLTKWPVAAFTVISYVLKHRTLSLQRLESEYYSLRDDAKEISMRLEMQNKELMDKQIYEINLATATERNRIARDIHDNVGHLLSRSILQIGAGLSVVKDDKIRNILKNIKESLSEAMNSIRASVHNLHERSVDLRNEIRKLIDDFGFCPITFSYDMETEPGKDLKYTFIAITKEALSNIIKHSNATEASVTIREHPALYQLIIRDNGSKFTSHTDGGIGLYNITERISALGGNVNISAEEGFRIFISVPKSKISDPISNPSGRNAQ